MSLCPFSVFNPISTSRIQWITELNISVVFSEVAHSVEVSACYNALTLTF